MYNCTMFSDRIMHKYRSISLLSKCTHIGVGAGPVGPVLTGPFFGKLMRFIFGYY